MKRRMFLSKLIISLLFCFYFYLLLKYFIKKYETRPPREHVDQNTLEQILHSSDVAEAEQQFLMDFLNQRRRKIQQICRKNGGQKIHQTSHLPSALYNFEHLQICM